MKKVLVAQGWLRVLMKLLWGETRSREKRRQNSKFGERKWSKILGLSMGILVVLSFCFLVYSHKLLNQIAWPLWDRIPQHQILPINLLGKMLTMAVG